MDCSPPGFSVHGILQARILEWVAISFSRRSSQPRNRTWVSCIAGRHFNLWATREAPKWFLGCAYNLLFIFLSSVAKWYPTLCDPIDFSMTGFTVLYHLLQFAQIHVHWVMMPSNHPILCHHLLFLPSVFPRIRVFSTVSAFHQVAKVLELQH